MAQSTGKKLCCVPFCDSMSGSTISFHEFPSNIVRRSLWLQAFPIKNFLPSDHSKICSRHFKQSDFRLSLQKKHLKNSAIPFFFEGNVQSNSDDEENIISSVVNQIQKKSSPTIGADNLLEPSTCSSKDLQSIPDTKITHTLPKPPMLQGLVDRNVAETYFSNVNKNTTTKEIVSTTAKGGISLPFKNFSNHSLKRKADTDNSVGNKIFKLSSISKNEAVNLFRQSSNTIKTEPVLNSQNQQETIHDLNDTLQVLNTDYSNTNADPLASQDPTSNGPNIERIFNKKCMRNRITQTTETLKHISKIQSKYAEVYHKYRNMTRLVIKKNKKIRCLQEKLGEMSEKLEYFENHAVMKKFEKMLVINDKGLASGKIQFLIQQIFNFDKGRPTWSDEVLRECVLLRASSSKGYEALQESGLFKLPVLSTLKKFINSTKDQTATNYNDCNPESEFDSVSHEPEFATESSCEPHYEEANETEGVESTVNIEEDLYFDLTNTNIM